MKRCRFGSVWSKRPNTKKIKPFVFVARLYGKLYLTISNCSGSATMTFIFQAVKYWLKSCSLSPFSIKIPNKDIQVTMPKIIKVEIVRIKISFFSGLIGKEKAIFSPVHRQRKHPK